MTITADKGGEIGREAELELITKFRSRTSGWSLNDDKAWVSVKLGEMRAVLTALDRASPTPNADEGEV